MAGDPSVATTVGGGTGGGRRREARQRRGDRRPGRRGELPWPGPRRRRSRSPSRDGPARVARSDATVVFSVACAPGPSDAATRARRGADVALRRPSPPSPAAPPARADRPSPARRQAPTGRGAAARGKAARRITRREMPEPCVMMPLRSPLVPPSRCPRSPPRAALGADAGWRRRRCRCRADPCRPDRSRSRRPRAPSTAPPRCPTA